jgi:Flp pilus assembly protein TadD
LAERTNQLEGENGGPLSPDSVQILLSRIKTEISGIEKETFILNIISRLESDLHQANQWLSLGLLLTEAGLYDCANEVLNRVAFLDPNTKQLWNAKAIVYNKMGRTAEATRCLKRALMCYGVKHDSTSISLHSGGARNQEVLDEDITDTHDIDQEKDTLDESGLVDISIPQLETEMEAGESHQKKPVSIRMNSNQQLFSRIESEITGLVKENIVRGILSKLKSNPKQSNLWFSLGLILCEAGRYDCGNEAFNRVALLDPDHKKLWIAKAVTYSELGKSDDATKCFQRAFQCYGENKSGYQNIEELEEEVKQYREHTHRMVWDDIKVIVRQIRADPKNPELWFSLGSTLLSNNSYEEAIRAFDRVLTLNPKYSRAWNAKAYALSNLGRHQDAAICYEEALRSISGEIKGYDSVDDIRRNDSDIKSRDILSRISLGLKNPKKKRPVNNNLS